MVVVWMWHRILIFPFSTDNKLMERLWLLKSPHSTAIVEVGNFNNDDDNGNKNDIWK